ncbi:MAG: hypothetical protein V3V33_11095 [Candidatus Lokiarchaeia archaeon]
MIDIEYIRKLLEKYQLPIKIYSTTDFKKEYLKYYNKLLKDTYGDCNVGLHFDAILDLSKKLWLKYKSSINLNDLLIKNSILVAIHEIGHRKGLMHCNSSLCFLTFGELAYLKKNQIQFRSSICSAHSKQIEQYLQYKTKIERVLNEFFK